MSVALGGSEEHLIVGEAREVWNVVDTHVFRKVVVAKIDVVVEAGTFACFAGAEKVIKDPPAKG